MSGPSEQPVPRQRSEQATRETPTVESPRPEVEHPADSARMPGVPRTQYTKMPTGPVSTEPLVASGPADTAGMPAVQWAPQDDVIVDDKSRLAPWALVAAIVALVAS